MISSFIFIFIFFVRKKKYCSRYIDMELSGRSDHNIFLELKPWKKNQWTKLICPVSRETSGMMIVIKLVTAGRFQMQTTLESEASIFVMIKQRFPINLSYWLDYWFSVVQLLRPCLPCSNQLLSNMYLKIPAGKHLMDLVAVDWFKDTKRIDHVARRQGCAAQVSLEAKHCLVVYYLAVD